jgi:hypothetical protein
MALGRAVTGFAVDGLVIARRPLRMSLAVAALAVRRGLENRLLSRNFSDRVGAVVAELIEGFGGEVPFRGQRGGKTRAQQYE